MSTHTHMGSKNISIKDEAYKTLKALQLEGESFSDTIMRLSKMFSSLHTFVGKGTLSDEEYENEVKKIKESRDKFWDSRT